MLHHASPQNSSRNRAWNLDLSLSFPLAGLKNEIEDKRKEEDTASQTSCKGPDRAPTPGVRQHENGVVNWGTRRQIEAIEETPRVAHLPRAAGTPV